MIVYLISTTSSRILRLTFKVSDQGPKYSKVSTTTSLQDISTTSLHDISIVLDSNVIKHLIGKLPFIYVDVHRTDISFKCMFFLV